MFVHRAHPSPFLSTAEQTHSRRGSVLPHCRHLPHDALECKARSCDRMSSVCLSDRLSVRPSVTLVDCDHLDWNSLEIISRLVSMGCSLSADPKIGGVVKGEHPEILARIDQPSVNLTVGDIRSQIATEWLLIAQRSQWRAYRKPPSLFRMVPSLTAYDLPLSQNRAPYASKIRQWPYLRNGWSDTVHVWFIHVGYGFPGRRIKWRYFRLHQIQVGGRPPSWIIANGHISATAHSIARIARSSLR